MYQLLRCTLAAVTLLCSVFAWGNAIWLTDLTAVYAIDPLVNRVTPVAGGAALTALATTQGDAAWVLFDQDLVLLEPHGGVRKLIDLGQIGIREPKLLAVDAHNDTMWISDTTNHVWHVSAQGALLSNLPTADAPRAMALAEDETLWVLGNAELTHYGMDGRRIQSIDLGMHLPAAPTQLTVDSIAAVIWIADDHELLRVDLAGGTLPEVVSREAIRNIALDHKNGILWALTEGSLVAYNDRGAQTSMIDLGSQGFRSVAAIALDPSSGALWFAHDGGVSHISPQGDALSNSQISNKASRVVAPPFWMAPRLSLLAPASGDSAVNSRPIFRLGLDALCSGVPCGLSPEFGDTFQLFASLDQEDVSDTVVRGPQKGQATFVPVQPLSEGSHHFSAVAIDDFGHESNRIEASVRVASQTNAEGIDKVDPTAAAAKNKAPTATWNLPLTGSTFGAGSNITVSANAADADGTISKVEFYVGTTLIGRSSSTSNPYTLVWSNVAAGTYSLSAKATDNLGASATSSPPISVTVSPNSAPAVSFSSPNDGAMFTAPGTIAINVTASDSDGSVATIDLYDGATLLQHFAGSAATLAASYTYGNVGTGMHTIKAVATDNLGASSTKTLALVGNRPPIVILTSPAMCGASAPPSTFNSLSAQVFSPDSAITQVEFYQDNVLLGLADQRIRNVYNRNASWTITSPGTYAFTAKAFDNLGRVTTSAPVTIFVESAPTVTLTAPADGSILNGGFTLTAAATDADGTISSVSFWSNKSNNALGTVNHSPYTLAVGPFTPGDYILSAKAMDNRGLATISAPVTVHVVDNLPPAVALTAPAEGAGSFVGGTVNIAAAASDPDGTVARVEFFYDGTHSIGTPLTAPPFSTIWIANVSAGTHTLTAKATDDQGATTTSAPVSIQVNAVPITLTISAPPSGATVYEASTVVKGTFVGVTPSSITVNGQTAVIGNGTFAASVPLVPGSNMLTVIATFSDGTTSINGSVIRVSPTASIWNVTAGQTIADDKVTLRGTVHASPNSAVVVNGRPATIDPDGNFFVNNLPLATGDNAVTATLVTPDGVGSQQTLNLTRDGLALFGLDVSPDTSLAAPATITLTLTNRNLTPYNNIFIDTNGDNQLDYFGAAPSPPVSTIQYQITYDGPGTYPLYLMVVDLEGRTIYSATRVIHIGRPEDMSIMIGGVYAGMLDRLRAGDREGALNSVTGSMHDTYLSVFNDLGSDLASVVDQLGTIQQVSFSDSFGEILMTRPSATGPQSFTVCLLRGGDSIWRIDGM